MEEKYNRIVLIGNGFDKALGLKTSYSDFILDYFKKSVAESIHRANAYTASYTDNLLEMQFKSNYYSRFHINEIKSKLYIENNFHDFMESTKKYYNISYKHAFFKDLIEEFTVAFWVNIENHYYKYLRLKIDHYIKESSLRVYAKPIIDLNKCMEEIAICLDKYIDKIEKKAIIDYMKTPLVELIKKMDEWLQTERTETVQMYGNGIKPEKVIFLNFNYTSTLKHILEASDVDYDYEVINIHGEANNKENPIIFGYGNDTGEEYRQIELFGENELLKGIKSHKYNRTSNYHKLLNYLSIKMFDVFIIGHSCGLSDGTLLNTIFEHDNCFAIQNFHYQGYDENYNKILEISRHFSDKKAMRDKILPYNKEAVIPQNK